ncbi:Uncharacterized protein Fot_29557 [Forsythia ovata]|uniref:Uncharacterized protein n=1 Tax=Forsythia ovata TaxID=205694 RepID=A0ABD1TS83_9LAMI
MGLMEMQLKVRNPKELKRPSGQPFVEFDSFAFDAPFQRKYKIQLDEFGMKKKSAVVKTYWMSYLGSRMHCTTYAEGNGQEIQWAGNPCPHADLSACGQEIAAHWGQQIRTLRKKHGNQIENGRRQGYVL